MNTEAHQDEDRMCIDRRESRTVSNTFSSQAVLVVNPETDKATARDIYLRSTFTMCISSIVISVLLFCIFTIFLDSKNEYQTMVQEERHKIEMCVKSYDENKCHPNQRVPQLEKYCQELEKCMESDPEKVAKRTVAFSTLVAENANKLFGRLEYRTIFVMALFIMVLSFAFAMSPTRTFYIPAPKHAEEQVSRLSRSKSDQSDYKPHHHHTS